MKVFFISYKYPPETGGMQKQSFELINGIAEHTETVTLIKPSSESSMVFFTKLKRRVRWIFRNHKNIDIVHCNDGVCAFFSAWIKKEFSVPVTCTLHGLDIVFPNTIYQKSLLKKLKVFDKIYCVSNYTAKVCLEKGVDLSKLVVINNGVENRMGINLNEVDPEVRNFIEECKCNFDHIIVSVGRPVKRKGFTWFAKSILPELKGRTCYVIIGPESSRHKFLEIAYKYLPSYLKGQLDLIEGYATDQEELNNISTSIDSNVFWLKELDFESMKFILSEATLFAMPNIKSDGDAEGFGLVALEASIMGKIVVASYIDGIKDAIKDTRNGFCIPPQNIPLWKEQVNDVLSMPEVERLNYELDFRAYTLENYSWDKMVWEYFFSMKDIVTNHTKGKIKSLNIAS